MSKFYVKPSLRTIGVLSELNFLATGSGEDADPKDGSWIWDEEI